MYRSLSGSFLLVFLCLPGCQQAPAQVADSQIAPPFPPVEAHFSPKGGCTDAVVRELAAAKGTVLVQAYSFTSAPIAKALLESHKRGAKVQVILDKSNRSDKTVTTSGTAIVSEDAIGFEALCSWLDESIVSHPAAHPADMPGLVYGIAGVATLLALLAYLLWPSDSALVSNPKFVGMMVLMFGGIAVAYLCNVVKFPGGSRRQTRPSRTSRLPDDGDV